MNSSTLRKQYSPALTIWLAVIVATSLLNSSFFIYPSLTPYFLFTTATALLFVYTAITTVLQGGKAFFTYNIPLLLLLLPACYITVHGYAFNGMLAPKHWYLLWQFLLIALIAWHFKREMLSIERLHKWLGYIAVTEAVICLLQWIGLLPSFNVYFTVTGTWTNPNVTAMFLAICMAPLVQLQLTSRLQKKWIYPLMMVLVVLAMLALRCRTAWLGGLVAVAWVLLQHYSLLPWLRSKSRLQQVLLVLLLAVAMLVTVAGLYRVKQKSADVRLAVWKTSMALIAAQPLTGYGYGNFEVAYNRFKIENDNKAALLHDDNRQEHVFMAYNEFIENTVEGGVFGLICLVAFFTGLLLFSCKIQLRRQATVCQAVVLAFLVMSCFNFTLQAIPVMSVLGLHAAFIIASVPAARFKQRAVARGSWLPVKLFVAGFSCYILLYQVSLVKANYMNRLAAAENKGGQYKQALEILETLEGRLVAYESYWRNCATALYGLHRYRQAADMLEKATELTAHPDLYIQLGLCYRQLNSMKQAENCFITAQRIAPDRLRPRVLLMQLYQQQKDFSRACYTASQILAITPKVSSAEALHYKEQAQNILHQQ